MDWHEINPSELFVHIREQSPALDAERTVWAFERAL
jgi:hypothetical protein